MTNLELLFEDFKPKLLGKLNSIRHYCCGEFYKSKKHYFNRLNNNFKSYNPFEDDDYDIDTDDVQQICHCYHCKSFYKEPLLIRRQLVCPNCWSNERVITKYDKEDQIDFAYVYNNSVADFQDYLSLDCGDPDYTIEDLTNYCSWITLFIEEYFKDIGLKLYFDDSVEVIYKYTTNL